MTGYYVVAKEMNHKKEKYYVLVLKYEDKAELIIDLESNKLMMVSCVELTDAEMQKLDDAGRLDANYTIKENK